MLDFVHFKFWCLENMQIMTLQRTSRAATEPGLSGNSAHDGTAASYNETLVLVEVWNILQLNKLK
jgi:hypothetical protein